MPTLYALMVGISEYPANVRRLRGCVNDVIELKQFLSSYAAEQGWAFDPKLLLNKDATRQAVIDGFSHFDQASSQDICVFYFSGHGSSSPAPDVFWNNPSELNESILCYDSRMPTGRDLMDKELAYLIWKATKKEHPHFLVVMDCCHAGNSTRTQPEEIERWESPHHHPPRLEDYLGYEEYVQREEEKISPPDGTYFLLAACRNTETAKEKILSRKYHGVFTHSLIRELERGGIFASYSELMQRCNLQTRLLTYQQSPQLEFIGMKSDAGFLGNTPKRGLPHQIFFDKRKDQWLLDAGAIQNIHPPRAGFDTILELEDGTRVKVTDVGASQSVVSGMEGRSINQPWTAWLVQTPAPPAQLCLADDVPARYAEEFRRQLTQLSHITLSEREAEADYVVRIFQEALILSRRGEEAPLFKRVALEIPEESVNAFLMEVAAIANWDQVLQMHNPRTLLNNDDIKLDLYVFTAPHIATDKVEKKHYENPREPVALRYYLEDQQWREPRYQLKLTNVNPDRTLWVSVLLMSSDYGIDNTYLRKQELQPGQDVWLTYNDGQGTKKDFEAYIDEAYLSWGIQEIKDYVKVIISTHEPNTDFLNQEPLLLDFLNLQRGAERGHRPATQPVTQEDWTVKTLEMRVRRPLQEVALQASPMPAQLPGIKISVPQDFSAKASLTSLDTATRSGGDELPLPPALWHYPDSYIQTLTPNSDQSDGLEVLELMELSGVEHIDQDHPIRLTFQEPLSSEEAIIPLGIDPDSGWYYPLGLTDASGEVLIQQLPPESPSNERSLGGSVKIFFQKTIGKGKKQNEQYSFLRLAGISNELTLEYLDDKLDTIREQIEDNRNQNIALFIHGIIGDTREMAKVLQRIPLDENRFLQQEYDLILTFDYENLHTGIDQTAKNLKEKLEKVGLGAGHGKSLHLIAHSMGGLVSRWMIEKEGGDRIVSKLLMLGTPNNGSPWANVSELISILITQGINAASVAQPWLIPLLLAGKLWKRSQHTLQQMKKDGDFMNRLNDGAAPPIPYGLIAGNTQLLPDLPPEVQSLFKRILWRFRNQPHYPLLDSLLFQEPNDIAVSTKSQVNIREHQVPVFQREIGCDHLLYFSNEESLKAIKAFLA